MAWNTLVPRVLSGESFPLREKHAQGVLRGRRSPRTLDLSIQRSCSASVSSAAVLFLP